MAYIGKTELKSSDVIAKSFTGNGSTTTFALDKVPPSEQAVLVSINGVKQHTDAYSISGTTLTLSAAPDSGDAIEAVSIIDIGESAGDSLPTQTGNSGKFLTTDGADSSWGTKLEETASGIDVTGTVTCDGATIESTGNTPLIVKSTYSTGGYAELQLGASGATTGYLGSAEALVSGGAAADLSIRAQANLVFSTGGNTERLRIDSSGRVTMSYQPAFHAGGSSAYTTRSSPVEYSNVTFNTGSHYSNSTYKFTAPVAGNYLFTAGVIAAASSAEGGPKLVKNGTPFARGFSVANERCRVTSSVINLAVNDWVAVYIDGETSYYLGEGYGYFSGHLIG